MLVLQPRRVAARAAAARIADEQGWALGDEVGYQVRFDRRFSPKTPLRFLTEGILTRQLLARPVPRTGRRGHPRRVSRAQPEQRPGAGTVARSSARGPARSARWSSCRPRLDAGAGRAVPGRLPDRHASGQEPMTSRSNTGPSARPASAEQSGATDRRDCSSIRDRTGHVLVFLPGMAEIRRLRETSSQPAAARAGAVVLPLHGSLPPDEQDRALAPSRAAQGHPGHQRRRDELDDRWCLDGGRYRAGSHRPLRCGTGNRPLGAVADQPCRRHATSRPSGPNGPGPLHPPLVGARRARAVRNLNSPKFTASTCAPPCWRFTHGASPSRLDFRGIDPPAPERLAAAERLLTMLGGLAGTPARITPLGTEMLALPVHPRLARLLVAARHDGRARDGAAVAALLSERDIRVLT